MKRALIARRTTSGGIMTIRLRRPAAIAHRLRDGAVAGVSKG
jgi:hypothetical protein